MKINPIYHHFKKNLITAALIVLLVFSTIQNSFAVDGVRKAWVDEGNGSCQTDPLNFNPFASADKRDYDVFDMTNPSCISFMAGSYAAILAALTLSNSFCDPATSLISSALSAGSVLSPASAAIIVKNSAWCSAYLAGQNWVQAATCCAGVVSAASAVAATFAAMGVIYKSALDAQKNTHICGETWNVWKSIEAKNAPENLAGLANYVVGSLPNDEIYVEGAGDLSYQKILKKKFEVGGLRSITNKDYREFIYGGYEMEDNGKDACPNPAWSYDNKIKFLGQDTVNQVYYMRGPNKTSNYACSRFLLSRGTDAEKLSSNEAYSCCIRRSQETVCIESGDRHKCSKSEASSLCDPAKEQCIREYTKDACRSNADARLGCTDSKAKAGKECDTAKEQCIEDYMGLAAGCSKYQFCKLGNRCELSAIWYEIKQPVTIPNSLCVRTYSVCPYNHNLGGGTEIASYDSKYPEVLLNHCQYLKHCVKKPNVPYIRTSNLEGGWISSACFDLTGDSQNHYSNEDGMKYLSQTKNFSAPIAQCFKETLENMFVNKAGNTKCTNPDEEPDDQGNCKSGYDYKAGETIANQTSFFQTIQNKLQLAIKLVMTIAITIMGISVLLTGSPWNKKTIIMFVIKLGLISYFALGTAWQDYFFSGVSGASTGLADVFMKVDAEAAKDPNTGKYLYPEKLDGCQFPRYQYDFVEGVSNGTKYDFPSYPPGKGYLKVWDTLDCKIAFALGFGPEVSVPNLIYMMLASFFTGGLGVLFFIATFIFAFYLISLTIRALHTFLISSMAITIMIYVSPITITACLFKKTEKIFSNWKTNLMGFVLQPVILFAYIGILITIFNKTVIGDARFSGDGISGPKNIVCSPTLSVGDVIVNKLGDGFIDASNTLVNGTADALNTMDPLGVSTDTGHINLTKKESSAAANVGDNSIYCIFHLQDIKVNNSLSAMGVAIPSLANLNASKIATIIKGAFLMFIFTQFLEKVESIAVKLIGGTPSGAESMGAGKMTQTAKKIIGGAVSRGYLGGLKAGKSIAKRIGVGK